MCLLLVAVQTCGQQLSRGLAFTELRAPSPGGAGAADKETVVSCVSVSDTTHHVIMSSCTVGPPSAAALEEDWRLK